MNEIARGASSVVGVDKHALRNVARVGGSEHVGTQTVRRKRVYHEKRANGAGCRRSRSQHRLRSHMRLIKVPPTTTQSFELLRIHFASHDYHDPYRISLLMCLTILLSFFFLCRVTNPLTNSASVNSSFFSSSYNEYGS